MAIKSKYLSASKSNVNCAIKSIAHKNQRIATSIYILHLDVCVCVCVFIFRFFLMRCNYYFRCAHHFLSALALALVFLGIKCYWQMNRAQCHIEHYPHFNEFDCISSVDENENEITASTADMASKDSMQALQLHFNKIGNYFSFFFFNLVQHLHAFGDFSLYYEWAQPPIWKSFKWRSHAQAVPLSLSSQCNLDAVASMVGSFLTVHLSLNMNLLPIGLFLPLSQSLSEPIQCANSLSLGSLFMTQAQKLLFWQFNKQRKKTPLWCHSWAHCKHPCQIFISFDLLLCLLHWFDVVIPFASFWRTKLRTHLY